MPPSRRTFFRKFICHIKFESMKSRSYLYIIFNLLTQIGIYGESVNIATMGAIYSLDKRNVHEKFSATFIRFVRHSTVYNRIGSISRLISMKPVMVSIDSTLIYLIDRQRNGYESDSSNDTVNLKLESPSPMAHEGKCFSTVLLFEHFRSVSNYQMHKIIIQIISSISSWYYLELLKAKWTNLNDWTSEFDFVYSLKVIRFRFVIHWLKVWRNQSCQGHWR